MNDKLKAAKAIAVLTLLVAGLTWSIRATTFAEEGPEGDETSSTALLDRLQEETGGKVRISYHAETGQVRFIGTEPDAAFAQPALLDENASPEAAARAFLSTYGPLFGLNDPDAELTVMKETAVDGRHFMRFQQVYQGVPVLGGELVVQSGAKNAIISANGEIAPDLALNTTPEISLQAARQTALGAIAKWYGVDEALLSATDLGIWIFTPALLEAPGPEMSRLVWRFDVTATDGRPLREFVLIDAQLGGVALNFNQVHSALNRLIYDKNNVRSDTLPGTGGQLARTEGQPATGTSDVDLAYDYSGDTYDFFMNEHGRDSLDDGGMTLISTVRFCPTDPTVSCPFANAFWNGSQMVYGDGYASADDVVGHELTHGVTDFTSHLFYYKQSGAINESLSDIWGEFIDQTNGAGNDTAGVKWLMGEDVPGGAIRDMANPPAFSDPDRITGANFFCGEGDSGGVHINSGVNNKAAFLMTDGGTFNGKTVVGMGFADVADLYYEAENGMLTSGSNFADLYDILIQASQNIPLSPSEQQEVKDALDAVEMNTRPCGDPPPPSQCPTTLAANHANTSGVQQPIILSNIVYLPFVYNRQVLFFDDLENSGSGNWSSGALQGLNAWYYPPTANPFSFDATYASSGVLNFWGYNQDSIADFVMAMNVDVVLPANAFMYFKHDWAFEDFFVNPVVETYDGGVVEYSTNGGTTWSDAGALFDANGYNGIIDNRFGNPLGGQQAFTSEGHGYTASRLDLSPLAGQSVRFRFRIGTDSSFDALGWFIDDVQIHLCS